MMRLSALAGLLPDVAEVEVTAWVARGWVAPGLADDGDLVFAEIDVARVRLIRDLRRDLDVSEELVPLVLSLLDQIYGLRSAVSTLSRAIDAQPEPVRAMVRAALEESLGAGSTGEDAP